MEKITNKIDKSERFEKLSISLVALRLADISSSPQKGVKFPVDFHIIPDIWGTIML